MSSLPTPPGTERTPTAVARANLAAEISEQQYRLARVEADGNKMVYELPQGATVVGSSPECNICLAEPTISRKHCVVERTNDSLKIRDLGSTNGTAVDGVDVAEAFLRAGSRVRVGPNVMLVVDVAYAAVKGAPQAKGQGFRGLVGNSQAMTNVFNARERLASSDVTVLITGETGTGKSALARSIHMASGRRSQPFIVFDCSAVAPNLIDAALFGHERGAFTGADRARVGAFEAGGEGTLFLDEITELPLDLQPKLLRALEEREFKALGSQRIQKVACRIITASQVDLLKATESGKFRRDLYYRLAVVMVALPPLRERKEDIPLIAEQLMFQLGGSITPFASMPEHVRKMLTEHAWPGNIRELRNYLERLTYLGDLREEPVAMPSTTALPGDLNAGFHSAKAAVIDDFERRYLEHLLSRTDNIKQAAEVAGINRRTLYDLLAKHGMHEK